MSISDSDREKYAAFLEGLTDIEQEECVIDLTRLDKLLMQLRPFYDTVQILCTNHDEKEGTSSTVWGYGNVYARQGLAREWLGVR